MEKNKSKMNLNVRFITSDIAYENHDYLLGWGSIFQLILFEIRRKLSLISKNNLSLLQL